MEGLSTYQHAAVISESVLNGQKKQALQQFRNALAEHCNASSLLADIAEHIGAGRALIDIAAKHIETLQGVTTMRKESTQTKTQHTPGPWFRNIRANGKYPVVFAGRNQHVATASQQEDKLETEANIDLIAAAPDLLAALRASEELLTAVWKRAHYEEIGDALRITRGSIANVEGR